MRTFTTRAPQLIAMTGVLFTLMLTSCTEGPRLGDISTFSNRSQTEEPFITIIRLKNQALLETAQRTDEGVLDIDRDLLAEIEKEQAATIEELQKISPEIKILFRYKSVLNGMAIWAPGDLYERIKSLPNVTMSEQSGQFHRADENEEEEVQIMKVGKSKTTSVKFIGAEHAYRQNIFGQGMRVGVIDTGIDYTHRMFGGEGTKEAFEAIDPSALSSAFPNKKVVGGIDLAGTDFDIASPYPEKRIPQPDSNPIDESGHGTHVAGTVAGIGDGLNTYDGVAPAASLYAIKVFGKDGSTTDAIVIAGLEYAVDPTKDLTYKEQLDVVNLSLGGGYGNPHIMYAHAIKNVVSAGTVVVASAGNDGDKPYIVGAPSITDDAISVASSIDNQDQNITANALEVSLSSGVLAIEYIESAISKPLADVSSLQGELIDLGLADKDLESPLREQVKGKIALIARGGATFIEKIQRAADAGAIAVVMNQNVFEKPFVMGGGDVETKFDIPAVMIDLENAITIRKELGKKVVLINMKPTHQIDKSFLIDTISDFSSRGPRSEDGIIKPEITAPGTNIISAGQGLGNLGVAMSGTSMAGPHIAGVMTLLKQKFNTLPVTELKSILLGHGKVILDTDKLVYPVSRQGAGRVQISKSIDAKVISIPATLSYGITDIEKQKTLGILVTFKNISSETITLNATWNGSSALSVTSPSVTLEPEEEKTVTVKATVIGSNMSAENEDLDGFLTFTDGKEELLQIPALVVARQISQIKARSLTVHSTSESDSAGSFSELVLENKSQNDGSIYLFNLLGLDTRKANNRPDYFPNRNCDMQSAGYRILESEGRRTLQIAVKLYEGMTTWHSCEVNVQIDSDGDNKVDQEIAGLPANSLAGLTDENFISLLLDGNKARELRSKYELELKTNPKAKEDYSSAVEDQRYMGVFDNSTLAIIEADVSLLRLAESGELNIKISTTHQDSGILEYDDYLGKQGAFWKKISVHPMAQGYAELPDEVRLTGKETMSVSLLKGYGSESLIMYAPQNKSVRDVLLEDAQSEVIEAIYESDKE